MSATARARSSAYAELSARYRSACPFEGMYHYPA